VENQDDFQLQKTVCNLECQRKINGHSSKKSWKGCFLYHFQTSSLKCVHKFWLEVFKITKGFLELKSSLIFDICLVQIYFLRVLILCLNEAWNFDWNTIPCFWVDYALLDSYKSSFTYPT